MQPKKEDSMGVMGLATMETIQVLQMIGYF